MNIGREVTTPPLSLRPMALATSMNGMHPAWKAAYDKLSREVRKMDRGLLSGDDVALDEHVDQAETEYKAEKEAPIQQSLLAAEDELRRLREHMESLEADLKVAETQCAATVAAKVAARRAQAAAVMKVVAYLALNLESTREAKKSAHGAAPKAKRRRIPAANPRVLRKELWPDLLKVIPETMWNKKSSTGVELNSTFQPLLVGFTNLWRVRLRRACAAHTPPPTPRRRLLSPDAGGSQVRRHAPRHPGFGPHARRVLGAARPMLPAPHESGRDHIG